MVTFYPRVVCRELGYPGPAVARGLAYYGQGTGPILLDDVSCRGNEYRLVDCGTLSWGSHNCGHGEDAGVTCSPGSSGESTSQLMSIEIQFKILGGIKSLPFSSKTILQ